MTTALPATGAAFSDSAQQTADNETITKALAQYNSDPALQQYVAQHYGADMWMMSIPELQGVLAATAYYGWTQNRVDSALYATTWWKSNGSVIAQWQETLSTDPAQAQQTIAQNKAVIMDQANQLGVQLTTQDVTNLASMASMFSWNSDTIKTAVAMQYQTTNAGVTPTGGVAATFQTEARSMLQSYAVPVSTDTINQWTTNAVNGKATIKGFQEYLATQAKKLYPFMSTAIDNGITPAQYLSPYASIAGNLLGVSSDSIDWSTPKWISAVAPPGTTGTAQPVSQQQFATTLRSDPTFGYSKTPTAVANAYSMTNQLEQTFGKVAS